MKKSSPEVFVQHHTHLKAGDKAPWFESTDQEGQRYTLDSFPGKTLVLYFYPKDDTEACTATACSLRDEQLALNTADYAILGVSADNQRSHAKFAAKYRLPFPLLADVDMSIIKAYNVWGQKMLFGRIYDGIVRTTFIIGADGVIRHVINNVDTKHHAQQIMALEKS